MVANHDHENVVRLLLDRNANIVSASAPHFSKALLSAAEHENYHNCVIPIVWMLLDAGANIHAEGDSVLYLAVELGETKIAEFLLAHGADVNGQGTTCDGHRRPSMLYTAYRKGKTDIVRIQLDNDADLNSDSEESWLSALMNYGNVDVERLSMISEGQCTTCRSSRRGRRFRA